MKRILSYIVVLGIFSFFFYQLRKNWDQLILIQWDAHPLFLFGHIFLMVMLFVVFVWGWKYNLAVHGFNINWKNSAHIWLVANLGKYIPGKVFMIAGRVELSHKAGVSRIAGFSAFVIENALMVFAAVPFLLFALLQGFDFSSYQHYVLIVIFILFGCWICVRPKIITQLLNAACRRLGQKTITTNIKVHNMVVLVGGYITGWLFYGLSGMLLSYAIEVPLSIPWVTLVVAFVASWVVGYITLLTPGGLGVREAVLVGLLTPEVQTSHAITLALIARLSWTFVEMMGALIGLMLKDER